MNYNYVSQSMYLLLKACSSVQLGKRQMSTKPQNYEQTPPISQQSKMCPHCEQLTSTHPSPPPQKKEMRAEWKYVHLDIYPKCTNQLSLGTCLWVKRRKVQWPSVVYWKSLFVEARESRKRCHPCHTEVCIHLRWVLFWDFFVPCHFSCCTEGGGSPAGRGDLSIKAALPLPSGSCSSCWQVRFSHSQIFILGEKYMF